MRAHEKVVEILLVKGADVNSQRRFTETFPRSLHLPLSDSSHEMPRSVACIDKYVTARRPNNLRQAMSNRAFGERLGSSEPHRSNFGLRERNSPGFRMRYRSSLDIDPHASKHLAYARMSLIYFYVRRVGAIVISHRCYCAHSAVFLLQNSRSRSQIKLRARSTDHAGH